MLLPDYIERLTIRTGARVLAVLVRSRSNPERVSIQGGEYTLVTELERMLECGVYESIDGGEAGHLLSRVSVSDPEYMTKLGSLIARRFGFTTVLEHADP